MRTLGLGLAAAMALGQALPGDDGRPETVVLQPSEAPTVRRRDRKNRKLREARNRRERRRLEAVRRERAGHERRARILAERGRRKAYMDLVDGMTNWQRVDWIADGMRPERAPHFAGKFYDQRHALRDD